MDTNLEENETPFLSPSIYKNQFQLLKTKQQRFQKINKNVSMTLQQEEHFLHRTHKALTIQEKTDELEDRFDSRKIENFCLPNIIIK